MQEWVEELQALLVEVYAHLLDREDVSGDELADVFRSVTESTVASSASTIADDIRGMVEEIAASAAQERQDEADWTLEHWRDALASYSAVVTLVDEIYGEFHDRFRDRYTVHASVIAGLMARATRIAREVDVLLRHGFGAGALARSRTLHEIAVVTAVIRGDETGELAVRYHNHNVITAWKRAGAYQRYAAVLGREPIPSHEMRQMRADRRLVIDEYGDAFAGDWGESGHE